MGIGDILAILQSIISAVVRYLLEVITYLWQWVASVFAQIAQAFVAIWNGIVWVGQHLWRGIQALRHLNFGRIWGAIKRAYNRVHAALDWYQRRIMGPIDRIRRQIWDIYRRFFKPILQLLDSFRVMVRFIAIFDRRLAAKLDAALFRLESKIMWPITAALKRLNEISSYVHAIITALGFLDRVMFLETLRRDASLAWEVLTNPRGRIFTRPPVAIPHTYTDLRNDVHLYSQLNTGPIADYVDEARKAVRETQLEVL